jgi:hypothetical protein
MVVSDAIESRGPRAIAPLEWKALFYARGLTSPLMDSQFDNDETLREIILGAEQAEFDRRAAAERD